MRLGHHVVCGCVLWFLFLKNVSHMCVAMRVKILGMAQHVAAEIQVKARAIGKAIVNYLEALGDDKEFYNTELHVHLNHEIGENVESRFKARKLRVSRRWSATRSAPTRVNIYL